MFRVARARIYRLITDFPSHASRSARVARNTCQLYPTSCTLWIRIDANTPGPRYLLIVLCTTNQHNIEGGVFDFSSAQKKGGNRQAQRAAALTPYRGQILRHSPLSSPVTLQNTHNASRMRIGKPGDSPSNDADSHMAPCGLYSVSNSTANKSSYELRHRTSISMRIAPIK